MSGSICAFGPPARSDVPRFIRDANGGDSNVPRFIRNGKRGRSDVPRFIREGKRDGFDVPLLIQGRKRGESDVPLFIWDKPKPGPLTWIVRLVHGKATVSACVTASKGKAFPRMLYRLEADVAQMDGAGSFGYMAVVCAPQEEDKLTKVRV
jgi:hypothetical protein